MRETRAPHMDLGDRGTKVRADIMRIEETPDQCVKKTARNQHTHTPSREQEGRKAAVSHKQHLFVHIVLAKF